MLTLLAIIFTFFATTFFGYMVHILLHKRFLGRLNTSHMTHHLKKYPKEDYLSETYRSAGKDAGNKYFVLAAIPFFASIIFACATGILPLFLTIGIFVEIILIGLAHNYLHDAFHVKDHWIEKTIFKKYFLKLRNLHYIHHCDMKKNFGIFFFMWDKVFKSFKNEK